MTDMAELSADRPSTDPASDLFGHAPFAKTLAKAITDYRASDGIVLALYGPWGSGKSTVLAYVQHELDLLPQDDRPVVVPFNPWWFAGQEHLAKAFLGQLQVVLPAKYEKFRAFGDKIAEFSDALGGVGDAIGAVTGQGWIGSIFRGGAKLAGRSPKDVPALKEALSNLLLAQRKRVVVVIDDIDRLAPDEVRQLFTVIKALADFPYVTYLLAFDREVAATAISDQTGLPGERYLEKIIQVPFELPRPDRSALQQALFKRLDEVMASTPDGLFDHMHWNNIFLSGIDPLVSVPRDVVRLTNALSVTYPAVVGEVNPVDFIAIEALRVFLPAVYDVLRTSPDEFTGHEGRGGYNDNEEIQRARVFHDAWLEKVPEPLRQSTKRMAIRLFPRLDSVWSNMHYGAHSAGEWRRQLRVCSPEIFPTYFKLSLSQDVVSRAEMNTMLAATGAPDRFAAILAAAADTSTSSGAPKVVTLLERFMDHVEEDVAVDDIPNVIGALLKIGDKLLLKNDLGPFDFGNESRVSRVVYHLLKRVDAARRASLLTEALDRVQALRCSEYLLILLSQEADEAAAGGESLLSVAEIQRLKGVWCEKVRQASLNADFIDHPSISQVVTAWREWGGGADAIAWWQAATANDENLVKLVAAQASVSRSQRGSDVGWRTHIRVDPRTLEPYGDIYGLADRMRVLLERGVVAEAHLPAARKFLQAADKMRDGVDPNARGFFDED